MDRPPRRAFVSARASAAFWNCPKAAVEISGPVADDVAMNGVAFLWDAEAVGGFGAIRIEIDGCDLAELIRSVELPFATAEGHERIAGKYVGLRPWQLDSTAADHFMGGPDSHLCCGPHDKTVLLGCECGKPGCRPLMAQVVVSDRDVAWRSFEQPHRRGRWEYDAFSGFVFDRAEYEAALQAPQTTMPDRPTRLSQ